MQEAYVAEISFAATKQDTAFASGHKFSLLPVPNRKGNGWTRVLKDSLPCVRAGLICGKESMNRDNKE